MKRKHYIDNLRWICNLLLIPYHAAMSYNCWGEGNYIVLGSSKVLSSLVVAISPWFMTLLFLLAGMSARYSLARRSRGQFAAERVTRILIPFLLGIVLIAPFLSYMADKTDCGYTGGYLQHYAVFFTRFTDLSGYDGGFTIGHLWFLLVLFVISMLGLLIDLLLGNAISKCNADSTPAISTVLLVLLAMAAYPVQVAGKSIVSYILLYLLGFYLFSQEGTVQRLAAHRWVYTALWAVLTFFNVWLFIWSDYDISWLSTLLNALAGGFGILSLLTVGSRHMNGHNKATDMISSVAFPVYIVHFSWVVVFQYWFSRGALGTGLAFILSVVCATAATIISCIGIKYCPIVRLAFGLKPPKRG